jgi:hypothetical protein
MKRLFVIEVFACVIAFSACKDAGGEHATVNASSNTPLRIAVPKCLG